MKKAIIVLMLVVLLAMPTVSGATWYLEDKKIESGGGLYVETYGYPTIKTGDGYSDPYVLTTNTPGYDIRVITNDYDILFNKSMPKTKTIFPEDALTVETLGLANAIGGPIAYYFSDSTFDYNDTIITYDNTNSGVRYLIKPGGLKEFIKLKEMTAITELATLLKYRLTIPGGNITIGTTGGIIDGEVYYNVTNLYINYETFSIAIQDPTIRGNGSFQHTDYTLVGIDIESGIYDLYVNLDCIDLSDELVYPVTIDPSIIIQERDAFLYEIDELMIWSSQTGMLVTGGTSGLLAWDPITDERIWAENLQTPGNEITIMDMAIWHETPTNVSVLVVGQEVTKSGGYAAIWNIDRTAGTGTMTHQFTFNSDSNVCRKIAFDNGNEGLLSYKYYILCGEYIDPMADEIISVHVIHRDTNIQAEMWEGSVGLTLGTIHGIDYCNRVNHLVYVATQGYTGRIADGFLPGVYEFHIDFIPSINFVLPADRFTHTNYVKWYGDGDIDDWYNPSTAVSYNFFIAGAIYNLGNPEYGTITGINTLTWLESNSLNNQGPVQAIKIIDSLAESSIYVIGSETTGAIDNLYLVKYDYPSWTLADNVWFYIGEDIYSWVMLSPDAGYLLLSETNDLLYYSQDDTLADSYIFLPLYGQVYTIDNGQTLDTAQYNGLFCSNMQYPMSYNLYVNETLTTTNTVTESGNIELWTSPNPRWGGGTIGSCITHTYRAETYSTLPSMDTGIYTVELSHYVFDWDDDLRESHFNDSYFIVTNPPNAIISAPVSNSTTVGTEVSFDGSMDSVFETYQTLEGINDDSNYTWRVYEGADNAVLLAESTDKEFDFTFTETGVFNITFQGSDGNVLSAIAWKLITVIAATTTPTDGGTTGGGDLSDDGGGGSSDGLISGSTPGTLETVGITGMVLTLVVLVAVLLFGPKKYRIRK